MKTTKAISEWVLLLVFFGIGMTAINHKTSYPEAFSFSLIITIRLFTMIEIANKKVKS